MSTLTHPYSNPTLTLTSQVETLGRDKMRTYLTLAGVDAEGSGLYRRFAEAEARSGTEPTERR